MSSCQAVLFPSLPPSQAHCYGCFPAFYTFFPSFVYDAADKVCKVEAMLHAATGGCFAAYFNAILILLVQQTGEKNLV